MHRKPQVVWLVVGIAFTAAFVVPPALADASLPTWVMGDFWQWRFTATAPGFGNGTVRMDVVGAETVRVAGIDYPSWRLQTTENFTFTGFRTMWENLSGFSWFRTSDLALVKQDVSGTLEYPGSSTTSTIRSEWDPPQRIDWPLRTARAWVDTGWMNTTRITDALPPSYHNTTITTTFVVEPERSVTVPAGTFAATPINGSDLSGDFNVTYWSPAAGNYVFQRSFSKGMQIYYVELTAYQNLIPPPDTERPQISHTPPSSPVPTGAAVLIEAIVTDNDRVAEVRLEFTNVAGATQNVTMTATGSAYAFTIPAQPAAGTIRYHIYAVDPSGNVNVTQQYALTIEAFSTGLSPAVVYGLIGVFVLIATIGATMVVTRRRKKQARPPAEPPPSTPP